MTSEARGETDLDSVADDRIVLAMHEGRDRELLSEWLASFPRYEVETADAPSQVPDAYDLCLVAAGLVEQLKSELQTRREQTDAAFLPHILVAPGSDGARSELAADLDELFDDVLTLPMEKAALRRRLENLLRARRAAVSLAARKQQYSRLIELAPEAVILVDGQAIVYANEAAGRLLDLQRAGSLDGREITEFVEGSDQQTLLDVLSRVREKSEEINREFVELSMVSEANRELYVAVTGVTVVYEGQEMVQLFVRDLTAEKERKQQLNLFERAMESSAQGITIADARQSDDPIIYANEGFERITGYPVEEILGQNCRFLQGDNTDPETVAQVREAIAAERAVTVDILNYRRDNSPFWNRLDIVPVEDEGGEVTHFLGLQRDITEEKEREQQLSVLNRVLRHNLRNKMNIIQVYATQLKEIPEAAEAAVAIEDAADELLTISEQIRKFDSIIAADERDLQTLDLARLVRIGVADLRNRHSETDIELLGSDEALIRAHETLSPALTDLLTLTDTLDGPSLTIEVAVEETAIVLTIVDRGHGLNRSDLDVVASGGETPLEHLQTLELWLIRWAVEESHGEFTVDTADSDPVLTMRFQRPVDRDA